MFVRDARPPFKIDGVIDLVSSLWRDASRCARGYGVELYAKASNRTRAERSHTSDRPSIRHAAETGVAIRALTSPESGAGFASASGLSGHVTSWVLDRALKGEARVSGETPDQSMSVPPNRADLDPDEVLPDPSELAAAVGRNPALQWIEAGTTIEVLVGAGGWHAVRRRHRVWALFHRAGTRVVAQRGFGGWVSGLERASEELVKNNVNDSSTLRCVQLEPDAAAPIVAALSATFYMGETPSKTEGGRGWTVADDPLRLDGLAGGEFDDAGFPAIRRQLAVDGQPADRIHGPGSLRRRSFRAPPIPAPTNLSMPCGGKREDFGVCSFAEASRVVHISPDLWVLELRMAPTIGQPDSAGSSAYIRISPSELLARCDARVGPQVVTSEGPIVPALRFTGLPVVIG